MNPENALPLSQNWPHVPTMNHDHPGQALQSYFFPIHFIIIFPSTPWLSKLSLSSRSPDQNTVRPSLLPHTCQMSHVKVNRRNSATFSVNASITFSNTLYNKIKKRLTTHIQLAELKTVTSSRGNSTPYKARPARRWRGTSDTVRELLHASDRPLPFCLQTELTCAIRTRDGNHKHM
jgi:hypothetical protein